MLNVIHNAQNINEGILNVLVDYDLRNRVIVVTLENASANNAAIEITGPFLFVAKMGSLLTGYHEELFRQRSYCSFDN